jgi:hypothetical protein
MGLKRLWFKFTMDVIIIVFHFVFSPKLVQSPSKPICLKL